MRKALFAAATLAVALVTSPVMAQDKRLAEPVYTYRFQMMDALRHPDPTVGMAACEEWLNRSPEQFRQDYIDVASEFEEEVAEIRPLSTGSLYDLMFAINAIGAVSNARTQLRHTDLVIDEHCRIVTSS